MTKRSLEILTFLKKPHTDRETAERFDVTRQRIEQIRRRADLPPFKKALDPLVTARLGTKPDSEIARECGLSFTE